MKKLTFGALAVAVAILALLAVSCEEAEPTAEDDWQLTVTANPASIDIGPNETESTQIIAVLQDQRGVPVPGFGIRFRTNRGTLASGGEPIETDSNGEAQDTLTLAANDSEAEVTASSGTLTASTPVFVGDKQPPTANLSFTPPSQARVEQQVRFSGFDSTGDIRQYIFTIDSDNPDDDKPNPEVVAQTNFSVNRTYTNPQTLNVSLTVEDANGLTSTDTGVLEVLGNLPPTADAGGPYDGSPQGTGCPVELGGCSSKDGDAEFGGRVVAYQWCISTRCQWKFGECTAQDFVPPREEPYNVTLTVWDNGNQQGAACNDPQEPEDLSACTSNKSAEDTTTLTCLPIN